MFMRRCSGVVSTWAVCALLCVLCAAPAAAQSGRRFEVGVQFVAAASEEFDTDPGVGVGLSWRPGALWSAEGEIAFYPTGLPQQSQFSRSRIEGLFGVGVGPLVGRVRPFARARAGFLTYRERSEPFPCIAIFPPPLACVLAGGRTIPAFDVGGGIAIYPTERTFIRVDLSDRFLRYPGPTFDLSGDIRDESFFSDDIRFAVGGGVRF
ncbi:MAG TPA: hypothetical protein VFB85_18800 [Vicinamibacterales bacterium]|jgi:hypothetical protein|nr:hypothetical protein [Vicinamibacterales bacterium]